MGRSGNRKILNSSYDVSDATILLAFLVVVVAIIFFYDGVSSGQQAQAGDPQLLLSRLIADGNGVNPVALIVGNTIDSNALNTLSNTNYDQLKLTLGIKSEFVIYFEDESGNLVMLGNRSCIGSTLAIVNGHRCGE